MPRPTQAAGDVIILVLTIREKLDLRLHSGVPVCLWSLPVAEIMFY